MSDYGTCGVHYGVHTVSCADPYGVQWIVYMCTGKWCVYTSFLIYGLSWPFPRRFHFPVPIYGIQMLGVPWHLHT